MPRCMDNINWLRLQEICSCPSTLKGQSQTDNTMDRKRMKYLVLATFCVFVIGVIYLGYFCPERNCAFSTGSKPTVLSYTHSYDHETHSNSNHKSQISSQKYSACDMDQIVNEDMKFDNYFHGKIMNQNHSHSSLSRHYVFDIDNDHDVLVFLHVQKTGGTTFGRHLVHDIRLSKPCVCYHNRKKCDCENRYDHVWLVSRHSTGWRCGLHADFTELSDCANGMLNKLEEQVRFRRFLYMTILRDPYRRYLSEFKHVRRGATWQGARLQCDGRQASLAEVPFCYRGEDWSDVSLDEFLSCPHNLAINRQTRMLANLSLSGCYSRGVVTREQRECIMLRSAKENLRRIAFFGLTEYQRETQYMFERTFGLQFKDDFFQYNRTHTTTLKVTEDQRAKIVELNKLDIELYRYAKELFFQRLKRMKEEDFESRGGQSNVGGISPSWEHDDDDYVEGDENFTEDDNLYNQRIYSEIVKVSKRDVQSNAGYYGGNRRHKVKHRS